MTETHETRIVLSGDSKGAESALSRVRQKISSITGGFGMLRSALTGFGLVGAFMGVVSMVDKIRDSFSRARKEEEKFQQRVRDQNTIKSIESIADAYGKVKDAISDVAKAQERSLSLIDREAKSRRELAAAKIDAAEQKELAAVNPDDADAEDQRRIISARYAKKREMAAASDKTEDLVLERQKLTTKADSLDRESKADLDHARALREKANQILRESQDEAAKSVDYNGADAHGGWEVAGSNARNLLTLNWGRIEMGNGDRAKTEAGDAVRAEHLQRSETLAKQAEQLAKQAEAAERSAKLKRDEAEHSRRTAEAMNGSVEAAKIDQETRQMKAEAAENAAIRKADENVREAENREKTRRADELSGFADRILAADGVSGNRLTAMGLGSGVSANGGVASDVKKLVDLLKQEVEQSKKIAARPSDGGITAVLGE